MALTGTIAPGTRVTRIHDTHSGVRMGRTYIVTRDKDNGHIALRRHGDYGYDKYCFVLAITTKGRDV